MARYNADGTKWSNETARETMDARFASKDFPDLSDLLGSDWGGGAMTAAQYRETAYNMLDRVYRS